jgi:hypothetical protein
MIHVGVLTQVLRVVPVLGPVLYVVVVTRVPRVVYILCPLGELCVMHLMCTEVVRHVMYRRHVFRMLQLLCVEGGCDETPGACVLHVLGLFGVGPLVCVRHTV